MDKAPPIVVIGASAGGVDAMSALAAALPAGFAAAVFVVLHIGAHKSKLPWLLNQLRSLRACHPKDGAPIHAGQIYVAPPDHHLLIEPEHVRLTRGPRENWARPAVDPLFRSAARAYGTGDRVFVILSEKYLRSPFCMFELNEVWRNSRQEKHAFRERVRVYTLDDADIWTTLARVRHAAHWRKQHDEVGSLRAR